MSFVPKGARFRPSPPTTYTDLSIIRCWLKTDLRLRKFSAARYVSPFPCRGSLADCSTGPDWLLQRRNGHAARNGGLLRRFWPIPRITSRCEHRTTRHSRVFSASHHDFWSTAHPVTASQCWIEIVIRAFDMLDFIPCGTR